MSIVAVTGGTGFLGRQLVAGLAEAGHRVRVLDRAAPLNGAPGVEYRVGDVTDPGSVRELLDGADAVLHSAFVSPHADRHAIDRVNVGGTHLLLRAAAYAGVRRFVLVSSTIVGRAVSPHRLLPGAPASRLAAYRWSRVRAELAVERAAGPMTTAIARPKTFVGPGQVGGYALVMAGVAASEPIAIFGPGTNRYQLVDVRDLADGLVRLVGSDATGVFGFGATEYGTVAEDLAALIQHAGSRSHVVSLPPAAGRAALASLRTLSLPPLGEWHECCSLGTDSVMDTGRAVTELGWTPTRSNATALCDAYDGMVESVGAGGSSTTHPVPATHRLARRLLNTGLARVASSRTASP